MENNLPVTDINNLLSTNKSKINVFTTINDEKKVFNLESNIDKKLNDNKGITMKVKDVFIKVIETPTEEGSLEIKKITILIDSEGVSYVTASKMFANQMIHYIETFGIETISSKGLDIKIIERPVKGSSNKALGFELV